MKKLHITTAFLITVFSILSIAATARALEIASSWNMYYGLIYKGAANGLVVKQQFEVWRGGAKIGTFVLEDMSDSSAKGEFKPDTPGTALKAGDLLKNPGGTEWTPAQPAPEKSKQQEPKTIQQKTRASRAEKEETKASAPEKAEPQPTNTDTQSDSEKKSYPRRIVPKDKPEKVSPKEGTQSDEADKAQEKKNEKTAEKTPAGGEVKAPAKSPDAQASKAPAKQNSDKTKRFASKVVSEPPGKKASLKDEKKDIVKQKDERREPGRPRESSAPPAVASAAPATIVPADESQKEEPEDIKPIVKKQQGNEKSGKNEKTLVASVPQKSKPTLIDSPQKESTKPKTDNEKPRTRYSTNNPASEKTGKPTAEKKTAASKQKEIKKAPRGTRYAASAAPAGEKTDKESKPSQAVTPRKHENDRPNRYGVKTAAASETTTDIIKTEEKPAAAPAPAETTVAAAPEPEKKEQPEKKDAPAVVAQPAPAAQAGGESGASRRESGRLIASLPDKPAPKTEPPPAAPAKPETASAADAQRPAGTAAKAETESKPAKPVAKTGMSEKDKILAAELQVYEGDENFANRDYNLALENYSSAFALNPKNEKARRGVMECSKKLGLIPAEAVPARTAAFGQPSSSGNDPLAGDVSSIQNNYGVYLLGQNQNEQALDWLNKAIKENPNIAAYYRNRAVANYRVGDLQQAVFDAKAAMDLGDEKARELLVSLRSLLEARKNQQARQLK